MMTASHVSTASGLRSGTIAGIGLTLLGVFMFAVNDVMGKWLVGTYSVGQVLLLRSAAALIVLLPLMARERIALRWPQQPGLHVVRVTFSTLEVACFYAAAAYLPLADVMTYYLAGPIYVAAIAVFWLGEKLDRRQVAVIAVGFVGVLIALRPSGETLTWPALIAVAGSLFYSFLMIATRKLREARDTTLVLGQILGALLFGAVTAPFTWVSPTVLDFGMLSLLGIVAMAAHMCINRALKIAPASVVAPYQYTLIVWAVLFGYLVFGDVLELWTLVGAAVICGAGLALLVIERDQARRVRAQTQH
jgi:drug/metabolite transporter (DMT)-like permease